MLNVSNLCIDYGTTRVVNQVDLTLAEDEILMLVGPTGCGKTTILQALAGLIPITEGEISIGNWKATAQKPVPPEKRNVGMMFQDFALFPHLTVEQNVCFRLNDNSLADHWLELLGLSDFRHAKPARLSGGQKQRVALARTLAHKPSYVLLDEPLSNLDAALKDTLRWDIRQALKEAAVPAIWVTHDQNEALSVGDRVGILQSGVLQQLAPPEQCFSQPVNRFIAGFLGEACFIQGQFENGQVSTELGTAPAQQSASGDATAVDVLLRPDDLSIHVANDSADANGTVSWVRFEGGSKLYAVTLNSGQEVKIRTSHESSIQTGEAVSLVITSTQPLATF